MDIRTEQGEAEFLRDYDPRKFEPVAVSVDVVALTIREDRLCVLLVKRATHPFKGQWALPGTFVRPLPGYDGFSGLEVYANRALTRKAFVNGSHLEQLGTFGHPGRDPRMHVVSVAYLAFGPDFLEPWPGDGVDEAAFMPVKEAGNLHQRGTQLAFDHHNILATAIGRVRDKLEYTTLATYFLPEAFTIGDLMGVYGAVWDQPINKGNFFRKVRATKGFIEPVDSKRGKAQLYTAGLARTLYPPIRREGGEWP